MHGLSVFRGVTILTSTIGEGLLPGCGASETEIQREFDDFVAAHNACEQKEDCAVVYPGCPLGCAVAVNVEHGAATERKAEELIADYESGGVRCDYGCPEAQPVACVEQRCDFAAESWPPEQCRSQCELSGSCGEEMPFDDYPSFDTTYDEWRVECLDDPDRVDMLIAGDCADGTRLLRVLRGFVGEVRFFAPSGAFIGLLTETDDCDSTCGCRTFWPEYVACDAPTVTEVLCGEALAPGDAAFHDDFAR